jgi:RNA polymerase sigma-70 factor (sigma-E family)
MHADQEREYVAYVSARLIGLRRTAYRLCGEWHRAEDLVQVALVLLYRHWRRASAAASLDAYVRRILVNAYLEDQRRWWSRRVEPRADPATPPTAVAVDARLDLLAALAGLPPGQRAVLVLRYWEGLDVAETAEALGCRPGTVKSQTSHAIAALRRRLPGYAGAPAAEAAEAAEERT